MSTRANVRLISFCMFLILAMLTLSATLIYSAGFQDLASYMTIEFKAEPIKLNFANNAGSNVNADTCSIVYNSDKSKFKIVGPVPKVENDTVTNLSDLTATSGAEFYYFCTNSAVATSTEFSDPQKIFYTSSSDTTLENWYDNAFSIANPLFLYSCFLVPDCNEAVYRGSSNSTRSAFVISNKLTYLTFIEDQTLSVDFVIIPQSVKQIKEHCFTGLYGAKIFVLPSTIEMVEHGGFAMALGHSYFNSTKLESMYFGGTVEKFKEITRFNNKNTSAFIYTYGSELNVVHDFIVYTIDVLSGTTFHLYTTPCLFLDTEITCYDEKRKRWYKKKLRDLTYKDKIVVWNFDEGKFDIAEPIFLTKEQVATRYTIVKLSDGAELKLIGENDNKRHRMFVKETGRFDYVNKSLIGKTTFNEKGEFVKIIDIEYVNGEIEFANIITKHHFNCFANGILTSCRLSNMYKIEDMKYVKDNRKHRPISDFKGVEEKYYDGLRLAEQPVNICRNKNEARYSSYVDFVNSLKNMSKENNFE